MPDHRSSSRQAESRWQPGDCGLRQTGMKLPASRGPHEAPTATQGWLLVPPTAEPSTKAFQVGGWEISAHGHRAHAQQA